MSTSLHQSIRGVWRLIGTRALTESGSEWPPPYGTEPHGLVLFHANRRMMCVLADGTEGLEGSREYLSYTGEYSIDDNVLATVVDGSSNPALLGKSQVREVSLHNSRLLLVTPPVAIDGDKVRREFVWEKLA